MEVPMWRTWTWSTAARICLVTCTLHAAGLANSVSAQQQPPADELAEAIARHMFRYDGGVRLIRGDVPSDLKPNFYVPRGTRVLGSVVTGSGVLVLATSTVPPESLRVEYSRALVPRGWTAFESPRRGGFVDDLSQTPLIFCRDAAHLQIVHAPRSSGMSDLSLNYRDGGGPCARPRPPTFRQMSEPQFPTLHSPPGAATESRARCYARVPGGRNSMSTGTLIAADTSAEEVLRHYGRQLESAGWRSAARTGRQVATGTWTRADSAGTTEVTLEVREAGTSGLRCYEVQMTMSGGRR
jgi:hypothetical protein